MTNNDMSTETRNESRELDAIAVDSKNSNDHYASKDDMSYVGKHAVLNEDEENLEPNKISSSENALGDLTNRGDEFNVRRELKGQRSRSALIFDEVDEVSAVEREASTHGVHDEMVDAEKVAKNENTPDQLEEHVDANSTTDRTDSSSTQLKLVDEEGISSAAHDNDEQVNSVTDAGAEVDDSTTAIKREAVLEPVKEYEQLAETKSSTSILPETHSSSEQIDIDSRRDVPLIGNAANSNTTDSSLNVDDVKDHQEQIDAVENTLKREDKPVTVAASFDAVDDLDVSEERALDPLIDSTAAVADEKDALLKESSSTSADLSGEIIEDKLDTELTSSIKEQAVLEPQISEVSVQPPELPSHVIEDANGTPQVEEKGALPAHVDMEVEKSGFDVSEPIIDDAGKAHADAEDSSNEEKVPDELGDLIQIDEADSDVATEILIHKALTDDPDVSSTPLKTTESHVEPNIDVASVADEKEKHPPTTLVEESKTSELSNIGEQSLDQTQEIIEEFGAKREADMEVPITLTDKEAEKDSEETLKTTLETIDSTAKKETSEDTVASSTEDDKDGEKELSLPVVLVPVPVAEKSQQIQPDEEALKTIDESAIVPPAVTNAEVLEPEPNISQNREESTSIEATPIIQEVETEAPILLKDGLVETDETLATKVDDQDLKVSKPDIEVDVRDAQDDREQTELIARTYVADAKDDIPEAHAIPVSAQTDAIETQTVVLQKVEHDSSDTNESREEHLDSINDAAVSTVTRDDEVPLHAHVEDQVAAPALTHTKEEAVVPSDTRYDESHVFDSGVKDPAHDIVIATEAAENVDDIIDQTSTEQVDEVEVPNGTAAVDTTEENTIKPVGLDVQAPNARVENNEMGIVAASDVFHPTGELPSEDIQKDNKTLSILNADSPKVEHTAEDDSGINVDVDPTEVISALKPEITSVPPGHVIEEKNTNSPLTDPHTHEDPGVTGDTHLQNETLPDKVIEDGQTIRETDDVLPMTASTDIVEQPPESEETDTALGTDQISQSTAVYESDNNPKEFVLPVDQNHIQLESHVGGTKTVEETSKEILKEEPRVVTEDLAECSEAQILDHNSLQPSEPVIEDKVNTYAVVENPGDIEITLKNGLSVPEEAYAPSTNVALPPRTIELDSEETPLQEDVTNQEDPHVQETEIKAPITSVLNDSDLSESTNITEEDKEDSVQPEVANVEVMESETKTPHDVYEEHLDPVVPTDRQVSEATDQILDANEAMASRKMESEIQARDETEVEKGAPILPRGNGLDTLADADDVSPHANNNDSSTSHMPVTADTVDTVKDQEETITSEPGAVTTNRPASDNEVGAKTSAGVDAEVNEDGSSEAHNSYAVTPVDTVSLDRSNVEEITIVKDVGKSMDSPENTTDLVDADDVSTVPSTSEMPEILHDSSSITDPLHSFADNDQVQDEIVAHQHQAIVAPEQIEPNEVLEVEKIDEVGTIQDQTDEERTEQIDQPVKALSTSASEVTPAALHLETQEVFDSADLITQEELHEPKPLVTDLAVQDINKSKSELDSTPENTVSPGSLHGMKEKEGVFGEQSKTSDVVDNDSQTVDGQNDDENDLVDEIGTIPSIRSDMTDTLSEATDVPTIPTETPDESERNIGDSVDDSILKHELAASVPNAMNDIPLVKRDFESDTEAQKLTNDVRVGQAAPVSTKEYEEKAPSVLSTELSEADLNAEATEAIFSGHTSPTIVSTTVPSITFDDRAPQSVIEDSITDADREVAGGTTEKAEPLETRVVKETTSLSTSAHQEHLVDLPMETERNTELEPSGMHDITVIPVEEDVQITTDQTVPVEHEDAISGNLNIDELHVPEELGDEDSQHQTQSPHSRAGEKAFSDIESEDLPPPYEEPLVVESAPSVQIPAEQSDTAIAGPSTQEKRGLDVVPEERVDEKRPHSPRPHYIIANQTSEPSEHSEEEHDSVPPVAQTDIQELEVPNQEQEAVQLDPAEPLEVDNESETTSPEADELDDISSSVQGLYEVDRESSSHAEQEEIAIQRPKTPVPTESDKVSLDEVEVVPEKGDMQQPVPLEDLSASAQTLQNQPPTDDVSELGTIPSEEQLEEKSAKAVTPVDDELLADDSVSEMGRSDVPEVPMSPRSELGSIASGFDSRSEVSNASRRPIAPMSPRLDPDVDDDEVVRTENTNTLETPVLPPLESAVKARDEVDVDIDVETPQPADLDADTSMEIPIPSPRESIIRIDHSEPLSGHNVEDELSNGTSVLSIQRDAADDVNETDGVLDVLPEELSRISEPSEVSSVTNDDPKDMERPSIVHEDEETLHSVSYKDRDLEDEHTSLNMADVSSHHDNDDGRVSYAESVSISDDPSISGVESEADGNESDISSIITNASEVSVPIVSTSIVNSARSVSIPSEHEEDRDDTSEVLSVATELSQVPATVSAERDASVVSLAESGYDTDVPLSEIEDEIANVDADNITLKPKDDVEAIPIVDHEEDFENLHAVHEPDSIDVHLPSKESETSPFGLSVSPNTIDDVEIVEKPYFKSPPTIEDGAADYEQISPTIALKMEASEGISGVPIIPVKRSTAQRPVSPKTLTPKKKREQPKHDRVSSGRSWDEIFHPRDDEGEDIDDARSRTSNGDVESPSSSIVGSLSRRAQKKRAALPTFVFPSTERMEEEPVFITKPEPLSLHTPPTILRKDSSASSTSPGFFESSLSGGRSRLESTASSVAPFFPGAWLSSPTLPERTTLDVAQGTFYASSKYKLAATGASSSSGSPIDAGPSSSTDTYEPDSAEEVPDGGKKKKKREKSCLIM